MDTCTAENCALSVDHFTYYNYAVDDLAQVQDRVKCATLQNTGSTTN